MKKFIALTLAGIMLLTSPMSVLADGIVYNGEQMTYTDQQPVIIDSRTYVPIRDVFEKLGFEVGWDSANKLVTLENDYYYAHITADTSKLFVVDMDYHDRGKKLESPVRIVNGRTMLPLREILEPMGYELVWDPASKTTVINDKNDYKLLDEKVKRFNNIALGNYDKDYSFDPSKPEGELTDEEIAYFKNLTSLLGEDTYFIIDFSVMSPDEIREEYNKQTAEAVSKLERVACPDSLKACDTVFRTNMEEVKELAVDFAHIIELCDDEPKNRADILLEYASRFILNGIAISSYELNNTFEDFFVERNINDDTYNNISPD